MINPVPIIVGFFCDWCSYRAADLAGFARIHYPPNLRIIRVMCSGRVEPQFVLQAFKKGADGVLIAGCSLGECYYGEGNLKALARFHFLKKILEQFGIERQRLQLVWISASDVNILVDKINNMTSSLKNLEPLNWCVKTS